MSHIALGVDVRVMSHILLSHVSHMNESCLTYEWVMEHIWMSHGTHMNESCLTYEWVMEHTFLSHVSHMTESYREGSVYTIRAATPTTKTTALKRGAVPSWQVLLAGASTRGTWLIYMRDMTHPHTSAVPSWQAFVSGAFMCVMWLIHTH